MMDTATAELQYTCVLAPSLALLFEGRVPNWSEFYLNLYEAGDAISDISGIASCSARRKETLFRVSILVV